MNEYFTALGSVISAFFNVVLLRGHPNESISGRTYREGWKIEPIINMIFFWEPDHCRNSYLSDVIWATSYISKNNTSRSDAVEAQAQLNESESDTKEE